VGFERLRAAAGSALLRQSRQLPPTRRLRYRMTRDALARLGNGPRTVLDAGCGDGLLAESIARVHPTWSVIGIDSNEEMLARARDSAKKSQLSNVEFRTGNITRSLGREEYDAVLAIECVTEIEDDAAAFDSLSAALRPGGLFVLHVPERDWRPVLAGSERTWRYEVRHGYDQRQLTEELDRRGLDVRRVVPTARGTVRLAQEIRDRIKERGAAVQALVLPPTLLAVWLEFHGLTWGAPTALYLEAVRR
jgi:trans-aconitate methyltransferase